MLSSPTVELWTPRSATPPPKPTAEISLRQIVNRAALLVDTSIKEGSDSYTPQHAEQNGNQGNCYARAAAVASILTHWEIPNFIVLNHRHASNFAHRPDETRSIKSFWFDAGGAYDAEYIANLNPSSIAVNGLRAAHVAFAETANQSTSPVARYFWVNPQNQVEFVDALDTIRSDDSQFETDKRGIHVVVTGRKGIEMLYALGKLKAYRKHAPKKYAETYDDLIDLVPTFRLGEVPPPNVVAQDRVD